MTDRTRAPIVALALALCAGPLRAADLADIKTSGTLRVLVPGDEIPEMFAFKRGASPGFEREILEGFAALNRVKLDVIPVDRFEDILPSLRKGNGDVVTGINDTPARREIVDFTVEVLPSRHVVVTRKPHAVVDTLFQFRTEKVGVLKGTTWADSAATAGAHSETFTEEKDLLSALKAERITATVLSALEFLLAQRHDPNLQAGVVLGTPGSAAWAVRKEDQHLKAALDDYLTNQRRTGSWSRLIVKYFGSDSLNVLGKQRD
jgi:ABC-type amino acid transport substrate-binding protein